MVYTQNYSSNCGEKRKNGSFMKDVLSSARLPKLFKRAKVIAIPKPGKDSSDPTNYRPIFVAKCDVQIT
jgi:hypothetical protein